MFFSNMERQMYLIFYKNWTVGAGDPPPVVWLHMVHFICITIDTLGTRALKSTVEIEIEIRGYCDSEIFVVNLGC